MRIVGGDKAILQEQPLVIMGAVADEHLLVPPAARRCSNLIAASFLAEGCFYLQEKGRRFLFLTESKRRTKATLTLVKCGKKGLAMGQPQWGRPLPPLCPSFISPLPLAGESPAKDSENNQTHDT